MEISNIYSNKSIQELKAEGSKRKIKYWSKMKKEELIAMLLKSDINPSDTIDQELVKVCREQSMKYIQENREMCRIRQREYQKRWRKNHPDKQKEYWETYWVNKLIKKGVVASIA